MDAEDKKELKEMFESVIKIHAGHMNIKFTSVHGKLTAMNTSINGIQKQVTEANGRTRKLEEAVALLKEKAIQHVIDCPQAEKIKKLQEMSSSMKAIIKFIIIVITIIGIIGGLYLKRKGIGV